MLTYAPRWPGYRKCECGHGRRLHARRGDTARCGRCRCRSFRWRLRTALSALHTPLGEIAARLGSYQDDGPPGPL